jgi:dihydrofolate reductase
MTPALLATRRKDVMGSIRVHEFSTLDGVIENPEWSFGFPFDPKMGEAIGEIMGGSSAILLGRRTFEQFAPAWSGRTAEQDPGAPFMNDTAKYVVSSTLEHPDWANSTVLGEYRPETINRLKERVDGGIYVSGSGTLVRAMLADGLVDELHLFVYPIVLGHGDRLFPEHGAETRLALHDCVSYTSGVVYLSYGPA